MSFESPSYVSQTLQKRTAIGLPTSCQGWLTWGVCLGQQYYGSPIDRRSAGVAVPQDAGGCQGWTRGAADDTGRHRTTLTLGRTGPWCLVENDPATILVTYYYIRDSLGSIPFPTTPSLLAKHRTRRSQLSCTCRSMPGRNFSYMWPWPTKGWSSLLIWMFEL